MKTLLLNNLIISYQSYTWTSDKTLLFLHWRGRSKEDWKDYFPALEKEQISYVALDFPWFWGSQLPKEVRGVKEYSEFILQFLEKLSIKNPIEIVAHSFGGRIAFYLAVYAPESIKKLFLIAPGGVEQQPSKIKKGIFTLGKHLLPEKAQQYLKKHLSSVDYQQAGKLINMFKKVVNEDLRALFLQISQPISLYWWENDDQIEKWQIDVMRKYLPNVKFTAFPATGHDVHQEQMGKILSDILA